MPSEQCSECARLKSEVSAIPEDISATTSEQVKAVRSGDQQTLMRLDKELEMLMGAKERSIGALLHHQHGHRD